MARPSALAAFDEMRILLITLGLFLFFFAVHLIIWRVKLPRHQIKALLMIFGMGLILFLLSAGRFVELKEILHISLFYGSMGLCYVITYSAIEADSPTLSLIRFLAEAGTAGRSLEEIARFMALRPFVRARLIALTQSGLIREKGERYIVMGTQPLAFRLILSFRKLYGPISRGG